MSGLRPADFSSDNLQYQHDYHQYGYNQAQPTAHLPTSLRGNHRWVRKGTFKEKTGKLKSLFK
jgi:hypothetical protein